MTLHKITLIVDDEGLRFLDKTREYTERTETFYSVWYEEMPTEECPTCGHENVAGDLIPCDNDCGAMLCYSCEGDDNYPCEGVSK